MGLHIHLTWMFAYNFLAISHHYFEIMSAFQEPTFSEDISTIIFFQLTWQQNEKAHNFFLLSFPELNCLFKLPLVPFLLPVFVCPYPSLVIPLPQGPCMRSPSSSPVHAGDIMNGLLDDLAWGGAVVDRMWSSLHPRSSSQIVNEREADDRMGVRRGRERVCFSWIWVVMSFAFRIYFLPCFCFDHLLQPSYM